MNADDALVRVVMWSEPQDNALFPGNVTMMMTDGTAEFSQINGLQLPGNYVIRIDYSEAKLPGLKIDVNIRSCIIGEEKSEDRKLCVQCPETQYNFLPEDSGCKDCPAHANCKQRNVIQPENNYWHDHPCSTHMQQCLSPEACVFDRRASHLANLTKDIEDCNVDLSITDQYAEGQCHKVCVHRASVFRYRCCCRDMEGHCVVIARLDTARPLHSTASVAGGTTALSTSSSPCSLC